jgi:hypothetical protein
MSAKTPCLTNFDEIDLASKLSGRENVPFCLHHQRAEASQQNERITVDFDMAEGVECHLLWMGRARNINPIKSCAAQLSNADRDPNVMCGIVICVHFQDLCTCMLVLLCFVYRESRENKNQSKASVLYVTVSTKARRGKAAVLLIAHYTNCSNKVYI